MRKRFMALMLAGAMVLSLAACNKNGNSNSNNSTDPAESTTAAPVTQSGSVSDYSQYVKLGKYTGLEVPVDAAVVTDEQIQNYKDSLVSYYNTNMAKGEEIKEGVTAEGDTINFDFTGYLDGEAFDGGSAKGYTHTVGAGGLIEDLERQLAGLEVGKEYSLDCTFPEEYKNNPDLAGKAVVFVVTVNYIEGEKPQYEWGDELVKLYTEGEYTSASAYEEYFTTNLLNSALEEQAKVYTTEMWNMIVDGAEIASLPEEKTAGIEADYYDYYVRYFTYYASLYGTDYANFLSSMYGMNDNDLRLECRQMAEQEVKYIMLSCEIYKDLGMVLTDEEYNSRATAAAKENGFDSAAAFIEEYGEEYVRESFIFDIVSEYLESNNKMVVNE